MDLQIIFSEGIECKPNKSSCFFFVCAFQFCNVLLCFSNCLFIYFLQTAQSFGGIGFGIKREIFFLNLEDGYFGCQVNESTDVLQLFELSKLCDGTPNCFLGSDELTKELKCTSEYKYFFVQQNPVPFIRFVSAFLNQWKNSFKLVV